ncbi:MAG: glutamate-5-semialdehyde dehydrogenase [Saprospiraceae bacterium]|jgi:glutamate-5-semialdehyde dehydrogenase
MVTTQKKNAVLKTLATLIHSKQKEIIKANQKDLAAYQGDDESMLDRLKADEEKVKGMILAIEQAIALQDPEGEIIYTYDHDNGMRVENRTVPFGNILIIYESRPDVTIEAAITAFKAGNKILLKGGKEARTTNLVLTDLWQQALTAHGLNKNFVTYLDLNREATQVLIKTNSHQVDLIIPRGGEGLINFVKQNTDIPVIISGRGNNFLFIDKSSDFEMAVNIILDGKSRISVCNALDKVLIHQGLPDLEAKIETLVALLSANKIEVVGTTSMADRFEINAFEDPNIYYEEFLAKKILVGLVPNMQEAISMINTYSGKHSAVIISTNDQKAERFLNEVDCAAVYHNASTRFTDGGQVGFGAEMAISTQKVHFRGPIGIGQLVTNKWFIFGNGQIRS